MTGRPAIALDVYVRFDLAELDEWEPEQIEAFFAGVAAVVAAQSEAKQDQ